MKIAYAGDWHANHHWATQAIQYAREQGAGIILHLGDYGYDFSPAFRNNIELALAQAHINLWFIDGNHEDFTWLHSQPVSKSGLRKISQHVYHIPRGFRWGWAGVKFLAVGGAYSVDRQWRKRGVSWWSEEVITVGEVEVASEGGPVDVLISHDVPAGFEIPGLSSGMWPPLEILRAEEHRASLRKIADSAQPREIWHGHYHVRYDKEVDFGYGKVDIHGLDMDATSLEANVVVVELPACPNDTNGDGDCGKPLCLHCGSFMESSRARQNR